LDFEVDARTPVIEFRNVTIKHTLDGPNVLQGLSFKIFEGERVAVIGRTGAGKSSIALSILGFTHIVKGQILVNGIDISTISLESLRAAVTYIPQDLTIFHGSMMDNLDMTGEVAPERLARALRVMQGFDSVLGGNNTGSLHETTLETNVSPNGINLGQGQRQIVGVGRAIARGHNLVITDEAMSSVDAKTNRQIQAAMGREVPGCTLLSITHRIDTILDHDKVIVLEWKRIVE
jgi:ABC-type multidrug transport system fused ATPase/permease subunit